MGSFSVKTNFTTHITVYKLRQSSAISSKSSQTEYQMLEKSTDVPKYTTEFQSEEIIYSNVSRWIEEFPHIKASYWVKVRTLD